MKVTQRWSEDSRMPRALRQAVSDARSDGPSAGQLARLIEAASAVPMSTAPLAGPSSSSLLLKLSGALVAAFAVSFVAMHFIAPAPPAPPPPPALLSAPRQLAAAQAAPAAIQGAVAAKAEPLAGAPQLEPPVADRPAGRPARRVQRALTPPQGHAGAPGDSIAEIELLQRAKRTLASAPRAALGLVEAHRRDFPRGAFAEEREAIAIEALHALGERARAAKQLATFRARHPKSAYLRRLDALTAPQ